MYYLIFDTHGLRVWQCDMLPDKEHYDVFLTREAVDLACTIVENLYPSSQYTPEQQKELWFKLSTCREV